ncbi:MAG: hypothetical protein HMLKMBBP_00311 [Planctomycetes bacterium]|nr:hypothetical protein [Planctomycetota bacterium]
MEPFARQTVNASAIARDTAVGRTTVESHLSILEGLVASHLRAWIDDTGRDARLRWGRTPGGSEVELVGYGKGVFAAIDVKCTRTVRSEDLRGLRAFREVRPEAKPGLLHRGRDRSVRDGVLLVPCGEFLRGVLPGAPPLGTA